MKAAGGATPPGWGRRQVLEDYRPWENSKQHSPVLTPVGSLTALTPGKLNTNRV